ncbi:MAG TPA: hypothetical protein PL143_01505 [Rhodocyclaceae bacterium]|nr:hypothetical protein [Rhodocyclaceae bacterium]
MLATFCRVTVEYRRLAAALEALDPLTDTDLYAKLIRASDTLAARAAQCSTRLRLAKNATTDSRAAARAVGDHRTPYERMRDRYQQED